jgi:hypothetical protein
LPPVDIRLDLRSIEKDAAKRCRGKGLRAHCSAPGFS